MSSTRARDTRPFIVMDVLERAQALERQGRRIVHLEVGEPDFDVPPVVREAAERALRDGATHYTHSLGIWELREAIAAWYGTRYGVSVSPDRVVVTAGTSGAFLLLFGALLEPGDGVLLADPGYPCYANFARFVEARAVRVPVEAQDGFAFTPARMAPFVADATAAVVSSPGNPTGTITSRATYEWLAEQPLHLISDEIYHGLRYDDGDELTALAVTDDAIVVDGLSKRFAMTGLRVGWTVVPERLVRPLNKLSQNLFISVTSVSQHAAVAALRQAVPDMERMVATYRERHDYLVGALRELGFQVEVEPQGAFYVFARMSHLHPDCYEFCLRMLDEAGVAATPGIDFGQHRTREYVRFAYTRSIEDIREGVRRLREWIPTVQEGTAPQGGEGRSPASPGGPTRNRLARKERDSMVNPVVAELQGIAQKARIFVSMPYIEGLTPTVFSTSKRAQIATTDEAIERRHGIFRMDEASLSPLDHGGLYGDAVFEGILIVNGQIFAFREHLDRWYDSAAKMGIPMPYPKDEMADHILKTVQEVGFGPEEQGYLRPVLTRGFGNLGIHPKKCIAPTIYCICSTIVLYPPEKYEVGIDLSIARDTRRATKQFVNPNIKSNNYLNNIFGLLETMDQGRLETLMLTPTGAVAEATADNVFAIERLDGWQDDPAKVVIRTPSPDYCLIGITRNIILMEARKAGHTVLEVPDMLPIDMVGPDREAFITGTGAGLMPIVGVQHVPVGDGQVGPVTKSLLAAIRGDMADPGFGLSITADAAGLAAYMARPTIFEG